MASNTLSFSLEDLKKRRLTVAEIEELHRHITPEYFDALLEGNTPTRPKIIINPETGDGYRLVPENPNDKSYANARYEKFEIKDQLSHHYLLDGDALDSFAAKHPRQLPSGYIVKHYKVWMEEYPKDSSGKSTVPEGYLSRKQFYALHSACSTDSRWWPLDTFSRPNKGRYNQSEIAILFHENAPVGYYMTRGAPNDDKPWLLNHLALLPQYRGNGLGGILLDDSMHYCLSQKKKPIELHTTDYDRLRDSQEKGSNPTRILYEKMGFRHTGSSTVTKQEFIDSYLSYRNPSIETDSNFVTVGYVSEEFFNHPETGTRMGRYTNEEMQRRLNAEFANLGSALSNRPFKYEA